MIELSVAIDGGFSGMDLTFIASREGASLGTQAATVTFVADLFWLASATINSSGFGAGIVDLVLVTNTSGMLVWSGSTFIDGNGNVSGGGAGGGGNAGVTLTSGPVLPNGSLRPLIIGDDYKAANSRALVWNVTTNVEIASCFLTFSQIDHSTQTRNEIDITGTADNTNPTKQMTFEIDTDEWGDMEDGEASFNVEMRDSAGNKITPVHSFIQTKKVRLLRKYT